MAVKYPIGKQDFKNLREGGFIYVDKTQYITHLLEGANYYFLARPRRFGKSLFVSTLEYFFRGERQLFTGLAIDSYPDWEWDEYPIIHIDLSGSNYTREGFLETMLTRILDGVELQYGVSTDGAMNLNDRFARLITALFQKTGKQVVVLIDEYEKPVTDNIDNTEKRDQYQEFLRGFYGVLKSLDKYLKLVFLTGVTKFGKMSIFSALNNLNDISLDKEYGAICGLTEEELLKNFGEGIETLAITEGIGLEEAIGLLKENYDGYHFGRNCPDIYNPFSILSALSKSEINPYWSVTGTPSFLIHLLIANRYNIENLEGIRISEGKLLGAGNQLDDPVPLFFQTGYLTIKKYDRTSRSYTLGFPNKEVEISFMESLLPYYQKRQSYGKETFLNDFTEGLQSGRPELAMKALVGFSASISYEIVPKAEIERHFQSMIFIFSRLVMPYVNEIKTEDRTSDGRIDLIIKVGDYIYLIEIKRDSTAEAAIKQIKEKGYDLQFKTDRRKVFLIGMNFSTEKRRLEDYLIERAE
ncbi:MAG: ATP-binding protein [Muribaculaceae bacterium]|nr:ATP-binding protein [Muribaculaceae bacterium]